MSKIVTPYQSSDTKKEQVQTMFDNIAPKYDLLNRILSFGVDGFWRKTAIKELKKYAPSVIVDIACGTGDFSLAALKVHPKKIIGIDISEEMLEKARLKISEKKLENTFEFIQGDSEQLQLEDYYADAVTVAFGVRNFEHLEKGISEIYRILKPNSPLVILEFSQPKTFPVNQLFDFYFKTICPFVGRLISKDPKAYTYLYNSVKAFPEGDKFMEYLLKAGFKNATCRRLTFGICSLYIAEK